jgi:Sec-independent protein translocase protein TatA
MDRFVQNIHGNSIKIGPATVGGAGDHRWEKVFSIQKYGPDGREVSTGYTRITEQEYELCRKDALFMYFHSRGKLIVHDYLPSAAQTPHEAILEARKQIRALQEQLQAVQQENQQLKKQAKESADKTARIEQELAASQLDDVLDDGAGEAGKGWNKKKQGKGGTPKKDAGKADDDGQEGLAF